jgi:hypothetical protein
VLFGIETRKGVSQRDPLVATVCGYSAFPKGPLQLVSRIPINHGSENRKQSHHKIPYDFLSVVIVTSSKGTEEASHRNYGSYAGPLTIGEYSLRLVRSRYPRLVGMALTSSRSCWSFPLFLSWVVKNYTQKRRTIGKYDFSLSFQDPGVKVAKKPSEEDSRQGPKHYKPWYAGSSYKVHPYWTPNLKYVC